LEAHLLSRLPKIPRVLRWAANRRDREFIGHPHHILKPYLPTDYRTDADVLPVASVVHIEAGWPSDFTYDSVDETRWVSSLPFGQGRTPNLGAIVVHADPRCKDICSMLDEHMAVSPLVRGVRCIASHHPDAGIRNFTDTPSMLKDMAFLRGFNAISQRGLSFDLWCYSHQLSDALTVVREYPETTFILNHYGTPVGLFGSRGHYTGQTPNARANLLARWREDLAALAANHNVVAKHSGLGMPLLGCETKNPAERDSLTLLTYRAAPLIEHLHTCFGSDRTMWASNYPIDKPGLTIPASIQILRDVLGAKIDLHKLLYDVAAKTYQIAPRNVTSQQNTALHAAT
jgi:predicted TIM-barrel fold metal-dependent hydrolase